MIENNIKALLGEYAFQICSLTAKISELENELKELKNEK